MKLLDLNSRVNGFSRGKNQNKTESTLHASFCFIPFHVYIAILPYNDRSNILTFDATSLY